MTKYFNKLFTVRSKTDWQPALDWAYAAVQTKWQIQPLSKTKTVKGQV